MANETGIATGLYARIVNDIEPGVAFGAIVHLHAIPAIVLQAGDTLSPYIPAIAGDAILLIRLKTVRGADMAVAGDAIQLSAKDVSSMRKKYAIRLTGIDPPRHFPSFG